MSCMLKCIRYCVMVCDTVEHRLDTGGSNHFDQRWHRSWVWHHWRKEYRRRRQNYTAWRRSGQGNILTFCVAQYNNYNNFMALNSLLCAHVPLRNCSLTHSLTVSPERGQVLWWVYLFLCLSICSHILKTTRPNFTKFLCIYCLLLWMSLSL